MYLYRSHNKVHGNNFISRNDYNEIMQNNGNVTKKNRRHLLTINI